MKTCNQGLETVNTVLQISNTQVKVFGMRCYLEMGTDH